MYFATSLTGLLLILLCISCTCMCGKIKLVEEPFSFNSPQAGGPAVGAYKNDNEEPHLVMRYLPGKPSGPPYLIENLNGKCFSLIANSYKYELCPFHNITQREQTYRWNAFNGVLGIWKEWLIDGNNFTLMHMVHGDPCAGSIEREVTVNLKCGQESVIVSVSEPSMCKYNVLFKTPFVCPKDVFFIYPMLSEHGKQQWRDIEMEYAANITTSKGYQKHRKKLFLDEGLRVDGDLNRNVNYIPNVIDSSSNLNTQEKGQLSSGVFSQDFQNVHNRFATKQQCDVEYTKLLSEVEMLRNQLTNITLMNLQSALSAEMIKGTELQDIPQNTKEYEKYKRGDLGVHIKNITENKSYLRKVDRSRDVSKNGDHKKIDEDTTRSRNTVQKKSKKRRKGDDGVLDEKSFPMRKLQGRMEYEANVISRLKVHGRLRDMKRSYNLKL